jgi:hypothetical protein
MSGILIFAEDPGATNYLARLPQQLIRRGMSVRVLADGRAPDLLEAMGIAFDSVPLDTGAVLVLDSSSPRVVVIGTAENPDTLGLKLVMEARGRGIPSVGVVDARVNAARRFRGGGHDPLGFAPDWLLVPDEVTKEAYESLDYPSARIVVCGNPHHEYVLGVEKGLANRGRAAVRRSVLADLPNGRTVLVFASEVSDGLDPEQFRLSGEYTLFGRGGSVRRTEIALEEFLDAVEDVHPRPYLVLRLHPKNSREDLSTFVDEFDYVSSEEDPLELIYAADAVVGLTSMLLYEAVLMRRPTMSIVPRAVELEWLPTIQMGFTPYATTRSQVKELLDNIVGRSPRGAAANDQADMVVSDSLQRVADVVEKVAGSPQTAVSKG